MEVKTFEEREAFLFYNYYSYSYNFNEFFIKYNLAISTSNLTLLEKDLQILKFLLKFPLFIRIVDFGLAFFLKNSNLRKRFIIANALFECQIKSFYSYFNTNRNIFNFFAPIELGFKFGFYFLTSFILFSLKKWN